MQKSIIRIGAAALVAGLIVFLTSAAPEANVAGSEQAKRLSSENSDRLPVLVKGAACSQRAWPNYEQGCLYDFRAPAHGARTVRVIALR